MVAVRRLRVVTVKPFEQIVAEHGPTVLRVCRAVLGPNEADDAWSETFLSAMRAYPDLRPGSNVEAWLVTIAKRKAIDQHRTRSRNPVPVREVPDSPTVRGQPGAWETVLWEALKELPRTQREAVAYHYLAGMPHAEVAEVLGNSEAAARRAAADGIKKLRATCKGEPR
jgi:RNA polymerase sigma factor (sigma-70 family)